MTTKQTELLLLLGNLLGVVQRSRAGVPPREILPSNAAMARILGWGSRQEVARVRDSLIAGGVVGDDGGLTDSGWAIYEKTKKERVANEQSES